MYICIACNRPRCEVSATRRSQNIIRNMRNQLGLQLGVCESGRACVAMASACVLLRVGGGRLGANEEALAPTCIRNGCRCRTLRAARTLVIVCSRARLQINRYVNMHATLGVGTIESLCRVFAQRSMMTHAASRSPAINRRRYTTPTRRPRANYQITIK